MEEKQLKTRESALADLSRKGLSIRAWAKMNGVSYATTAQILRGTRGYRIGASHKIAVLLGLKDGEIVEENGDE